MTESQRTSKFLAQWRKANPLGRALKHNDYTTSGILDAELWYPRGRTVRIEFKLKTALTPLQAETVRHLESLGHEVYVVRFLPCRRVRIENGIEEEMSEEQFIQELGER